MLNSTLTPTSIPDTEIVAKVESAIRPLDTEQANSVRRTVNNLLQKAQPPKTNVTKDKKQALKEDNTILLLTADKGRASQFSAMSLLKIVKKWREIQISKRYIFEWIGIFQNIFHFWYPCGEFFQNHHYVS